MHAPLARTILLASALTMVAGSVCAWPGIAQAPTAASTFIAVPESFPDIDARAMGVREPGRDVIVLDPDEVTADALAMSLLVLERMRVLHPTPVAGQMVPITGFVVDTPASGRYLRQLEIALARLRRRPVSDLGTLGWGQWVRYREETLGH